MTPEEWASFRQEWREALPRLIAGESDRTDLMIPLDRIVNAWQPHGLTLANCLEIVEEVTGHSAQEIRGCRRYTTLCNARKFFLLLVTERLPHKTRSSVAQFICMDHSSVIYALKRCGVLLQDPDFAMQYKRVLDLAAEREKS